MEPGFLQYLFSNRGHANAPLLEFFGVEAILLYLRVASDFLECDGVEVRNEDGEDVLFDVGHFLDLGDDVRPQIPGPSRLCIFVLQRDHPGPSKVPEASPYGLLLRLRLLLSLEELLFLIGIATLCLTQNVLEDVRDLLLHL